MKSKEKPNHTPERETIDADKSESQASERAILSMAATSQDFNGGISRIMNIADKAGVDIEKDDSKELQELLEQAGAIKEEFFDKILTKEGREKQKNVIEKGEKERASTIVNSILEKSKKVINNKSFQKVINHLPYVGDLIMITKMVRGREGAKKLTAREYLFYSATVLSAAVSFYYLTQGNEVSAGVSLSVSEGVSYVDSSIGIIKDVSEKLMAKNPKLAGILSAVSNSFSKGKEIFRDISVNVANTLKEGLTPNYAFEYAQNEKGTA